MTYDFGGSKLLYHLDRVAAWQRGEIVTPIIYEISLTDACNSRCRMCPHEMSGRRNLFFPQEVLDQLPQWLSEAGTKSYFLAGNGEPLLHSGVANFCAQCARLGVEGSLSSNGIAFSGEVVEPLLNALTWVRFTVLSFSSEYYKKFTKGGDYSKQIRDNIQQACCMRARYGLPISIGVQQILLDDNIDDIISQCKIAKELGVDYFVIMPGVKAFGNLEPPVKFSGSHETYSDVLAACRGLSTDVFHVAPEDKLTQSAKSYDRCFSFPFVSRIYPDAKVYPCFRYWGEAGKVLGDLSNSSLMQIWHSERTQHLLKELTSKDSFKNCQLSCRANMTNTFLYTLTTPPKHVNFI